MNILVYKGEGTSVRSVEHIMYALKKLVGKNYDIKEVDHSVLNSQPWETTTKLLVIPGGRDRPYQEKLHPQGTAKIRLFVENGGCYMGICAGAYFACSKIAFDEGTANEIVEERNLCLFRGIAIGSLFKDYQYGNENSARIISLKYNGNDKLLSSYYNGGCFFEGDQECEEILFYDCASSLQGHQKPAVIMNNVGKGKVILSGVHLEYTTELIDESNRDFQHLWSDLKEDEEGRVSLLKCLLENAGLQTQTLHSCDSYNPSEIFLFNHEMPRNLPVLLLGDTCKIPLQRGSSSNKFAHFDVSKYFAYYRQSPLIYSDLTTSTQTILDQNSSNLTSNLPSGTVFLAGQQISGRGRGQNQWISSSGCIQFTMLQRLSNNASIIFLQYLVAMTIVDSFKKMVPEFPVFIKWPNDIYYKNENDVAKIGGILINSSFVNNEFTFLIGVGVNLFETSPMMSATEAVKRSLGVDFKFGKEEFLANFMIIFNSYLDRFIKSGFDGQLNQNYKDKWLHTDQIVYLEQENVKVKIEGLSKEGYLRATPLDGLYTVVYPQPSVKEYILEPDGNSFDMMKNLIKRK